MGGCFISLGLFISSLTKNQIVAGVPHLRDVPDAVDHQLDRRIVGPDDAAIVLNYLSITEHFDDFARGHHRHQARRSIT